MSLLQKGGVDGVRGRFRDGCLNRVGVLRLTVARAVVGDYRQQYNEVKLHDWLGHESLAIFMARARPFPPPPRLRSSLEMDNDGTKTKA